MQRKSAIDLPGGLVLDDRIPHLGLSPEVRPRRGAHRPRSPARADDMKFVFSSIVVNDAPSGMLPPHPRAAQPSASAITTGANRKPVPAMSRSVTSTSATHAIWSNDVADDAEHAWNPRLAKNSFLSQPRSPVPPRPWRHANEPSSGEAMGRRGSS